MPTPDLSAATADALRSAGWKYEKSPPRIPGSLSTKRPPAGWRSPRGSFYPSPEEPNTAARLDYINYDLPDAGDGEKDGVDVDGLVEAVATGTVVENDEDVTKTSAPDNIDDDDDDED